jgi:hypothetical protein
VNTQPHLRLIDAQGEVQDVCEHCLTKDAAIERLTRSYEGTIQRLKQELDDRRDDQADLDPQVLAVVEDWCRHADASGWWTQHPRPTTPRLDAARQAMNRGNPPGYLMLANAGGFIEAATERKNPRFKRAYLEPATLYGKFIDSHAQTALDPENERVRALLAAPKPLLDRWPVVLSLADPCDHCGHIRLDHDKPSLANDFTDAGACLVHGCGECPGFDDFWFQSERWMARHARGKD